MSEEPVQIEASLGGLELKVQADSKANASELFDAKLTRLLEEAGDMSEAIRDASRGMQ